MGSKTYAFTVNILLSDQIKVSNHFRIGNLDPRVPVSFVYGKRSWIDANSGFEVQSQRPNCYVKVETVPAAGHHVYADNHEAFNLVMKEISDNIDADKDQPATKHTAAGDAENHNDENSNYQT